MTILGISALYHDSAAALVRDGEIVAAAQEERFTRKKHDHNFPVEAIKYCLSMLDPGDKKLDAVAFYDKPIRKFERILTTYFSVAPAGLQSAIMALPLWLKQKLWVPLLIEETLEKCGVENPPEPFFFEHHQSHAASAFFPSPFERAAILTIDGVGEWATTAIGRGEGNRIELLKEIRFPHSLGLLYSAFTYFTGFRVNSGEYKLMGLAPYGKPVYVDTILNNLIDLKDDGSFRLNMKYFNYLGGLTMTNNRFAGLFGGPARKPEAPITEREADLARSIQEVTEIAVMRMARHAKAVTGEENLCLAGGVALNCVANGKILQEGIFKRIWIQPAAGDAGGALGAALMAEYHVFGRERKSSGGTDRMKGSYLGPEYGDAEIEEFLTTNGYPYEKLGPDVWAGKVAELIDQGNVIGLLRGRMEFGPRALGARSIIGDARSSAMQEIMNIKIKFRESFRPFAPSCLEEKAGDFFDLSTPSPYMLLVAPVAEKRRVSNGSGTAEKKSMRDIVNTVRSDIPAITHVDYSARIQTVDGTHNRWYHDLISAFEARTGYGIIINTSFNIRGEPIVCTPHDAYRCFMCTEMDYLVLGPFVLAKKAQPDWSERDKWKYDGVLD